MNIVQISFLLGHEQLQTTMVYLDITIEASAQALATLETENDKKVTPKWKKADGSLVNFCGFYLSLDNEKNPNVWIYCGIHLQHTCLRRERI